MKKRLLLTIILVCITQLVLSQEDITPNQLLPIELEHLTSETSSNFGRSISMSSDGSVIAIGDDDFGLLDGRVQVFTNETGEWVQKGQDILGIDDSFNKFGYKVQLSADGNTIAISDPQGGVILDAGETFEDKYGDTADEYFSYIQVYGFNNGTWSKIGDDFLDYGNLALSGDGTTLAISTGSETKIYEQDANAWIQKGSVISGRVNQQNTNTISLSNNGNRIIIGDPYYDDNSNSGQFSYEGQAKVYDYNSNTWSQIGNTINGIDYLGYFGDLVNISGDGNTIAIATSQDNNDSTPYIAILEFVGNNWISKGVNISESDNKIVSMELSDDGNAIIVGGLNAARVLKYNTDWEQINKTFEAESLADNFGYSVTISGNGKLFAVGAPSSVTGRSGGSYGSTGGGTFTGNSSTNNSNYVKVFGENKNSITQLGDEIYGEALYDALGNSVSVSENGNIIAVGASGSYQSSSFSRVMVYEKTVDGLVQIGENLLKPTANNRSFGAVVKLSSDGSLLAVSDPLLYNSAYGAVYIYQRNGDSWIPFGNPIIGKYGSSTGTSISFSKDGSIIAVGSYGNPGGVNNDGHRGYTTVYKFNNTSNSWEVLGEEILGEDTGDYFGISVDLSGDGEILAVGATGNDGETVNNGSHGHVRVFKYENNSWIQLGSDIDGDPSFNVNFGGNVKLSKDGETLFASDIFSQSSAGSVNIYNWNQTINEWEIDNQLKSYTGTGSNNSHRYEFGSDLSVSDDGNILVIGEKDWQNSNSTSDALGKVYIYIKSDDGWVESELFLEGRSRRQYFGEAVSISGNGNTLAVGGYGFGTNGTNSGMAAVYEINLCSTLANFQVGDDNIEPFTSIPDANFEQYLIDENIDSDATINGKVLTSEIENVTELLINNKNIANLTGIADFKNLVELSAANNQIRNLDITNNLQLEKLFVANNLLSSVILSNNLKLTNIDIGENQFTEIDIHLLPELESLSVYKNQLTEINLISNEKLKAFIANENELTYVDARNNTELFWLDLDDNLLEDLMLKNGNNTKITHFSITGNPNLSCVEVDDVNFSNTNWTEKDGSANYSLDCAPFNDSCVKAIPLNFNQQTQGDVNSGTANNTPFCAVGNVLADVWFSVVVPDSGEFSIEGFSIIGQVKFAIYSSCQATTPISCGTSISLQNLTVGETFYLKVWIEEQSAKSTQNTDSGLFTITASESSVLSVNDLLSDKVEMLVFPNPAKSKVSIALSNNKTIEKIEVFSILGDKVYTQKSEGQSKLTFDVSNLASGIYFVKAKTENGIISKKLVIK